MCQTVSYVKRNLFHIMNNFCELKAMNICIRFTLLYINSYILSVFEWYAKSILLYRGLNISLNMHFYQVFEYDVSAIKQRLLVLLCRYLISIIYIHWTQLFIDLLLYAFYFHLPSVSSIKQCSKGRTKNKVKYGSFVAFNGLNKCPRSYYKYKLHTKKVR